MGVGSWRLTSIDILYNRDTAWISGDGKAEVVIRRNVRELRTFAFCCAWEGGRLVRCWFGPEMHVNEKMMMTG